MNHPLLLGHRGARADKSIPENTIASFDRALADGCDGFEFDVRLTADGTAIVCHDPTVNGLEIAQTLAANLPGKLPTLDEVLTRFQNRAFLDIELKVAGLERITVSLLRAHPPRVGVVVSSFLPEVLRSIHAEDSNIPLGLICETERELSCWTELPVAYVIPHYSLFDSTLMKQLSDAEKKVLVWTVNSPDEMRHFRHAGVDGIISDDTRLLRRTIRG
jgi:glycerophosphoryl diester phosphodiesterase